MGAFEAWVKGGLEEVILPSGLKIKGKLPLTQDMVVGKTADTSLLTAVAALGDREIATYDDAERVVWVMWQRVQAAAYVREIYDPMSDSWEPVVVSPDMLANGIPPLDVDALEDIVIRRRTATQVTAHSRFLAGDLDEAEMKRILLEEASGTINAWSTFRHVEPGPVDGEDGGDVRRSAEHPPGEPRSVRRARARSGPRAPTRPRTPQG